MKTRIDLEDAIIAMDSLTDLFEVAVKDMDVLSKQRDRVLEGLIEMYRYKHEQLWDVFKQVHKLDEYRDTDDKGSY